MLRLSSELGKWQIEIFDSTCPGHYEELIMSAYEIIQSLLISVRPLRVVEFCCPQ